MILPTRLYPIPADSKRARSAAAPTNRFFGSCVIHRSRISASDNWSSNYAMINRDGSRASYLLRTAPFLFSFRVRSTSGLLPRTTSIRPVTEIKDRR